MKFKYQDSVLVDYKKEFYGELLKGTVIDVSQIREINHPMFKRKGSTYYKVDLHKTGQKVLVHECDIKRKYQKKIDKPTKGTITN